MSLNHIWEKGKWDSFKLAANASEESTPAFSCLEHHESERRGGLEGVWVSNSHLVVKAKQVSHGLHDIVLRACPVHPKECTLLHIIKLVLFWGELSSQFRNCRTPAKSATRKRSSISTKSFLKRSQKIEPQACCILICSRRAAGQST